MKDKEKGIALDYYMRNLNQKEIAEKVGVAEKTLSRWIKQFGWKTQRDAKTNSIKNQTDNLRRLIEKLTEQRLAITLFLENEKDTGKIIELNKRGLQISSEVANYNKALENILGKNRIPLSVYIDVMENIFNALRQKHPNNFIELIDFQKDHLSEIAIQYQ